MRMALMAALLLGLAACDEPASPRVNANVAVTPDGVRVYPSASARVGGVGVSVWP